MRRLWVLLCFAGCNCQPPPTGVDAGVDPGVFAFSLEAFGPVLRGESVERTGTFTNGRREAVEVTDLALTPGAFELVGPTSLQVPPGGEATLTVRFAPAALGAQVGALTFTADSRAWSVDLRGDGIGPALGLEPERLDLGTVPLYEGAPARASATLMLRNLGLDAVPTNQATALQAFFDVQSTSAAAASELCAGDCTGTPFSLPVDALTVVPVELTSPTAGVKTWDVRLFSNDPTSPMRTIPVTAEVVARPTCQFALPATLDFGVVTQPERRELELIFENVGAEPCEVSRIFIGPETPAQSSPLFSVLNPGAQTIAPGEVLRVQVRAAPQDPAPSTKVTVAAELRLELNHPDGFARVALSADLLITCLWVSPSPVDFGTVQTGCRSADRAITLKNVCTQSLVVTSAVMPGFSSFSASAALPRTLAINDPLTLTARFTPFAPGPSRSGIEVSWLDGTEARRTVIPLVGEANATGDNTDRYPPLGNKLDLLLVLDDSASMLPRASQLAAQLPTLLTELQARAVDFRLGVVTGSLAGNPPALLRRLTGGARWLSPTTVELATRFAEVTAVTGTHSGQACEWPALTALTPPMITDPLFNGGFRRADAALSVLCLTASGEEARLLPRVLELPARPRWDTIGPVGPSAPGCSVDWSPLLNGAPEYAQATGGEVLDVCAADWRPLLTRIAAQTTGPRTVFPLKLQPDPLGTIAVTVSGQPASSGAWAWESTPNLVRFVPASAPLASAPVEISYPTVCTP